MRLQAICLVAFALLTTTFSPALGQPTFDQRYYYTISNVKTTGDLVISSWGANGDGRVVQGKWPAPAGDNARADKWLLMPTNDKPGEYFIVNGYTGAPLVPKGLNTTNEIISYTIRGVSKAQAGYYVWKLKRRGGGYTIVNKNTRKGLVPNAGGTQADVVQWGVDANTAFEWKIKRAGPLPNATQLVPKTAQRSFALPFPDQFRLKGYKMADVTETPPVTVGVALLPYWGVNDTDVIQDDWQQIANNPYYILKRTAYWKRVVYQEQSGGFKAGETETVAVGTENETESEKTVGFSLTASASVEYEGGAVSGSAGVEATMERQLSVRKLKRETSERTIEIDMSYLEDKGRVTRAVWMRVDEYTLSRPGSKNPILTTHWVDKKTKIEDGWPKAP